MTSPPGPPARLGLRNTLSLARDPLKFLRHRQDSHPDDIERVMVKRDAYVEILERTLGKGLLTSEGDLWKRQDKLMSQDLPKYAYFPFGGGPRVCIGNHFAMMEAILVLGCILRRYHLELLRNQRLRLTPSVTLRVRSPGLKVRASIR